MFPRGQSVSRSATAKILRIRSGWRRVAIAVGLVGFQAAAPLAAQTADDYGVYGDTYDGVEAHMWFDRGAEPIVDRGERLRIYFRVSEDAYAAVFQIDTDGRVHMIFPKGPDQETRLRGGRDYRLLFEGSSHWRVSDHPGRGYFFMIASPTPLDFSDVYYARYAGNWDLSGLGNEVYRDPYLAMDDYVASLVPDWEYGDYGLDVAEYSVGDSYQYPRFMCYECHGYQPYVAWNPYYAACTSFRVVIWDDPWYYPYYGGRYRGVRVGVDRVVYDGRRFAGRPRFEFKERGGDESAQPLVMPRTNPGETAPRRRTTGAGVVRTPSRGGSIVDVPERRGTDRTRAGQAGDAGADDRTALPGRRTDGTIRTTAPPRADRPGGVGTPGEVTVIRGTTRPDRTGPDRTGVERRPVLERRPPRSGSVRTRPSDGARPSDARARTGTVRENPPATRGRVIRPNGEDNRGTGSRGRVIPPLDRSGGASAGARTSPNVRRGTTSPPAAGSRSGATQRPTVRAPSGGSRSGGAVRAPTRGSRSGGAVRPAPARSGSVRSGSARASTGSRGSVRSSGRVQVRRRGGGV